MMKLKLFIFILVLFVIIAGIVWAAADPEPGSREDPLITKSYVDHLSAWQRVQVASGGAFNICEGTEWVVVFTASNSSVVSGDKAKLDKVFDLTAGSALGEATVSTGHHYICAASGEFAITFASDTQLLVRGAP
jgi:hypothetical protein